MYYICGAGRYNVVHITVIDIS